MRWRRGSTLADVVDRLSGWRLQIGLAAELGRWAAAGHTPRVWWRDDDVRRPTPALERLLAIAAGRPLALAVIPDGSLAALRDRLAGVPVTIGQHGIDHVNRADGGPPSEFPPGAPVEQVAAAIGSARARMAGQGLAPVFFTPPWNACRPDLAVALSLAGHTTLSAGRDSLGAAGLVTLSAEVDILRWSQSPRFRGAGKVTRAIGQALRVRRQTLDWSRPIGILTHHLDHDEAAWRFLSTLAIVLDRRFRWVSVGAAVGGGD